MPLYNDTTFIGNGTSSMIYQGLVENVGGNDFMALMIVVLTLIIITMMFKFPLEASAIMVLPFLIFCFAYTPDMISVLGVTLIYLGVILGKALISWFR